jgi:DNA-binding NtrC family response regulator
MLISGGYKYSKTASGMEALTVLASETKVALIVSELLMADLDGIGLVERVREKYPDIPVVLATEVNHLGVAVAAFRCDARDYLLKPFDQESLHSVFDNPEVCGHP